MSTLQVQTSSGLCDEVDREKVLEQMNRLLETHHFRNSRRYPALLRFIVEETLEGRGDLLKERLLGVRVFDRPADYDTASDPIVRVTIAEIRKRIAQYYHDEEHDAEIRIELLPGRYAPEFRARRDAPPVHTAAPPKRETKAFHELQIEPSLERSSAMKTASRRISRKALFGWCLSAIGVVGLASIFALGWMRPSATDQFWAPILRSQHSVLFCLPTDVGKKGNVTTAISNSPSLLKNQAGDTTGLTFLDHESLGENVVYSDMLAALSMANILAAHHHEYRVRLTISTTLDDLRYGPVILVGGLDNQWTMRALAPLRYRLAGSDEDRYWIADSKQPDRKDWSLDLKQPYAAVTRDYAIIARLHNEQTNQPEMIIAGIGMSGTAAAGQFVADESRMKELRQRLGAGIKDRDFEVVLSTDVVNGIGGSPTVLAVAVW